MAHLVFIGWCTPAFVCVECLVVGWSMLFAPIVGMELGRLMVSVGVVHSSQCRYLAVDSLPGSLVFSYSSFLL